MSEHIQPAPDSPAPPAAVAEAERHEKTPGVAYERERFDFRLILRVGAGLAVTVLIVQVIVWWLFGGLEEHNRVPAGRVSELAKEDAARPFDQRLDNVPAPHLEGIEPESSLLEVRTEAGEKLRFYTSIDVRVRIGENKKARLFDLREGQRVTLTYYTPDGVGSGLGVVTSVTSPPRNAEQKRPEPDLPNVSRTFNVEILRVVPRSIAASREWAETQMERYGWIDRDKGIVHVPVEKAMDAVAKEFRAQGKQKKSEGRTPLPTRSSSGRAAMGGQR
ncbi:MAG TPA: hypothetical protein VMG10_25540 [Gemmataceae bacterium]|nr:hypothetical protein [Gemmataceae bacterium]